MFEQYPIDFFFVPLKYEELTETYQFSASWYPSKVKDGIGVGSQL